MISVIHVAVVLVLTSEAPMSAMGKMDTRVGPTDRVYGYRANPRHLRPHHNK